jgi:hypothetical protein
MGNAKLPNNNMTKRLRFKKGLFNPDYALELRSEG